MICAQCYGDCGMEIEEGWHACYHCRQSGSCDCEECIEAWTLPATEEEALTALLEAQR